MRRPAIKLEDPEGAIAILDQIESFYIQPRLDDFGALTLRLYAVMANTKEWVLVRTFKGPHKCDAIPACSALELRRVIATAEIELLVVTEDGRLVEVSDQ